MGDTFYIKKGATSPTLVNTLSYAGGQSNLVGASGTIEMRHQFGGSFSKAFELSDQATYPKRIEVPWTMQDADDLQIGTYYVEYHVQFADGKIAIFPTEGDVDYDRIEVQPSLV